MSQQGQWENYQCEFQAGLWDERSTSAFLLTPYTPKSDRGELLGAIGWLVNLQPGPHPVTWKPVMSPHVCSWWPAGEKEGELVLSEDNRRFPPYCCQANAFHRHSICARNASEKRSSVVQSAFVHRPSMKGPQAARRASLVQTHCNKL